MRPAFPAAVALLASLALPAPASASTSTLDEVRELLRAGDDHAAAVVLHALGDTLGDDGAFLLGRLLVRGGHPAAGLAHLERLPTPWKPVEDRRLLWLARARSGAGAHAAAIGAATAALATDGLSKREAAELRLLRADAQAALGDNAAAVKGWQALAGNTSPRDLVARALRALATTLDGEPARKAARRLLESYPDLPAADPAGLPVSVADLGPKGRTRHAKALMQRFRYHEARAVLKPLTTHPTHGPEARWQLALIGLRKLRDDAAGARTLLRQVVDRGGAHAEEALYLLMRTFIKEDRYPEALRVADRYDRTYPRGTWREAVAYYRAFLPYDERRCDRARRPLRRYIESFGRRRSTARGYLAWCDIREQRWADAIRSYEKLVPYGGALLRGKAWFWQAIALDRLGRRDAARKKLARLHREYPLTWYDVLGQQELARWDGRDPRASRLPWPDGGGRAAEQHPHDPDAWSWPRVGRAVRAKLARVKRLSELGEIDRARDTYRPLRSAVEKQVPESRRLAYIRAIGHAVEDYEHGWRVVSDGRLGALHELPDPTDVRYVLGYPRAYGPLVERLAREASVPAAFVYGVMRQESRYQPAMISAMDAVGALQMIPQTAELVAADLGLEYDAVTFADPRVGFPYSLHYMTRHDAAWDGRLTLTAASYNAGPTPVARWLRENPGQPLHVVVEEMTYTEARAYCRKVTEHTLRYLYLYEPDAARRGELLDRLFPVDAPEAPVDVGY